MRSRPLRAFAPSLVVTLAACSGGHAPPPKHETPPPTSPHPYLESNYGRCEIMPDCTPPASDPGLNPCNPPPPTQVVDCPPDMIATPPPDLEVVHDDDGTCHVDCDAAHCDSEGQLRVQCDAPAASYAANLIIPAQTTITVDGDDGPYTETRNADLRCDLTQHGQTYTNVMCPSELAPHVAPGVVPVMSTKRSGCYYGTVWVACPYEPYKLWH
jgi:hypothetical protein